MSELEKIKEMTDPFITPAQAATVMKCTPHALRVAAHNCPDLLGFPVCVVGSRVKIPRIPFVEFWEGKDL